MTEEEDHGTPQNDGAIDKVAVYLCGVAAQHELGETDVRIYHSAERLKGAKGHRNCGIAEYEMRFVRWVEPQGDLSEGATRLGDVEVTKWLIADTEALIGMRQEYLERLKLELQHREAKTLHLDPDNDY